MSAATKKPWWERKKQRPSMAVLLRQWAKKADAIERDGGLQALRDWSVNTIAALDYAILQARFEGHNITGSEVE